MAEEIKIGLELEETVAADFSKAVNQVTRDAQKAQTQINNVGKAAKGEATKGIETFAKTASNGMAHTAGKVGAMTSQLSSLGTNVLSGNLPGAIQSFVMVAVQGFKTVGMSAAIATGGISIAVGTVIYLVKSAIDENKKLEEMQKKSAETIASIEKKKLALIRNEQKRADIEAANERDASLKTIKETLGAELTAIRDKWKFTEDGEITNQTAITASMVDARTAYRNKFKAMKDAEATITEEYAGRIIDNEIKYYWEPLESQQEKDANNKKTQAEKDLEAFNKKINGYAAVAQAQYNTAQVEREEAAKTEAQLDKEDQDKKQRLQNLSRLEDERFKKKHSLDLQETETQKEKAKAAQLYAEQVGAGVVDMLGAFAQLNTALRGDAEVSKALAVGQATINTALGVTKAYAQGGVLGFVTGAGILAAGIAQIATIKAQKFGKGGDFVTSGPQMIMVGDNPGGQERVQVTPLSSPNYNGPKGGAMTISMGNVYISGSADSGVVRNINEGREKQLRELRRMLRELNYAGQMV